MSTKLLKSGIVVSAMTFLSRILGLVRDIVMANLLGASWVTDVFLVAQKIPNFLRRLFAEGAFSQAFIPVLSEYQTNKSSDQVKRLIAETSGTLGLVLLLVTIVGVIGSPALVGLFGPGFVGEDNKFELASLLLKITFPYILFVSLTAFSGSVLNSVNRFAVPAFTPVLLNISMISAAVIVTPALPDVTAHALAWGIFAAGVIQLLFQLPFLWKEGLLVKPKWGWESEGVQKILKLMGPALFGVSVAQINLLLDTVLASFLEKEGSITWLYYSDRMLEFPLGIFAIAISTVILPLLSRQHASKSQKEYNETLNWGLRMVFLIGLPSTAGLFMLAEPVMLSVFQHGEFTLESAHYASLSLKAYIIGLMGFMLIKVLATGFYSRQDTKTPVRIAVIALVTNMVFNLILFYPLAHVGLALATAISAIVNSSLLFINLKRDGVFVSDGKWIGWFARLGFANLMLILFIAYFVGDIEVWREWNLLARIQQIVLVVFGSIAVYAASLYLSGVKPKDFRHT